MFVRSDGLQFHFSVCVFGYMFVCVSTCEWICRDHKSTQHLIPSLSTLYYNTESLTEAGISHGSYTG